MRIADASSDIRFGRRRVQVTGEGQEPEIVTLPGFDLPILGRSFDLWSQRAGKQFADVFQASALGAVLDRKMFNVPMPLVLRVTEGKAVNIPWEAFQRLLDPANRTKLATLRDVDPDGVFSYSVVGAPMRCVVLVGHPGSESVFVPEDAEAFLKKTIREAMMANGHTPTVSSFQIRADNLGALPTAVGASAPNVVIYFGHGQNENGPRLLLSETEWVPLSDVANALFAGAATKPPFWIFWACSLAEGADQPLSRMGSASTLDALTASDGVAMLAMRSRIGVDYARPMLEALIGAFAAGEPLEVAAAYARAAGLAAGAGSTGRMDDAAPAVWSRSRPVEAIRWDKGEAADASWTILPLLGADGTLPELATGLAPVDEGAIALATSWQTPGRYFVTVPISCDVGAEPAARARLLAAAAVLRRMGGRLVVPIVLRAGERFDQRLRLWGDAIGRTLDPRRADRAVAAAIGAIARDGLAGLPRLLAVPDIVVLLSEPPDRAAGWDVLEAAPASATVVVAGQSLPREAEHWTLDQLMADASHHASLDIAMKAAPLSCGILGVTERPLSLGDVAEMARERGNDVAELEPLLVKVGGRRVLGQTARRKVVVGLEPATVEAARRRCVAKLEGLPLDFEALIEVSRQHVELRDGNAAAEAINAAWREVGDRWTKAQRRRLFGLAAEHPAVRDGMEDSPLLNVAQATVELHETRMPRLVLERLAPAKPAERMLRHALLAECYKADLSLKSAPEIMERHAREAVTCAKEVAAGDPNALIVLHQRHNLARIRQYFRHDYDEALAIYVDIQHRLGAGPNSARDGARLFATCARNSAECLLDPAARPIDQALRDRIEEALRRGRDAAEGQELAEVAADIDYTLARTAEAAGDDAAAYGLLNRLAIREATEAYPLLSAIAAVRLFWNEIRRGRAAFAWDRFSQLLRVLDLFHHGWAVRVAIRSRVRAVRFLLDRAGADDVARARGLVEVNVEALSRNPGLTGHDDARSEALTMAAADVMAGPGASAWATFVSGPKAVKLPHDWIGKTAAQIWEESV